jgi:hypothetical protein
VIAGTGYLGVIRLHSTEKIRATVAEIQEDYSRSVNELASLPKGGPVCCELWIYSRYGRLRFFRVLETGLEEIEHTINIFKGREMDGAHSLAMHRSADQLPGRLSATGPASPGLALPRGHGDPAAVFNRNLRKTNSGKKPAGGNAETAGSPGASIPLTDMVSPPGETSGVPLGTPDIPSSKEQRTPSPTENGVSS